MWDAHTLSVRAGQVRMRFIAPMQSETGNENNFEYVYTLLKLDEPSAQSIRALDNIMGMSYLSLI